MKQATGKMSNSFQKFSIVCLWSLLSIVLMAQQMVFAGRYFGLDEGKVLQGHVIETHHVTSSMQCGFLCIRHQLCLSYNYKEKGAGGLDLCELNNATRKAIPGSYRDDAEYKHYYNLKTETSRSCLDYLRNGATENGIYTITDVSGETYPVWCDVTSEPRSAWTLILSLALKNRHTNIACRRSLSVNAPTNENSPNWQAYRLSLNRMKLLASQSTHWRATTGFKVYGIDFTDYMRGKLSVLDILSYVGDGGCKTIEYINIRGYKGTAIEVPFWQKDGTYFIHTDSSGTLCAFRANNGASRSENNFGYYCQGDGTLNRNFRGSKTEESTSEWWFGGYL